MKILQYDQDVTTLREPKERAKFFEAAMAFGWAMAEQAGQQAGGHPPKMLGQMFAFQQLMGRQPRPDELGDLKEIAVKAPPLVGR